MKNRTLSIDAKQLAQELAWTARTCRHNGHSPALTAVHISAVVGALRLRRTDYQLFAESNLRTQGGGQANILIDPTKLNTVLKGANGPADIDISDTEMAVTLDGRTVKLRSAGNLDDYPEWPTFIVGDYGAAILTTDELARALTSIGEDPALPMLTGVRFEDRVMVSTDRLRLTRINYAGAGMPVTALIPGAALRAFTRGDELVIIDVGQLGADGAPSGVTQVVQGQRSIIARVLKHDFPKWRQLIPDTESATVRVVIRRDELLEALSADDHQITLTITADGIKVLDKDRDGDMSAEQDVPLFSVSLGDGLPFTVGLRAKFLKAALKAVGAGLVHFEASNPHKPVALRALNDKELHLIMPIRMPA
jgi:DNA polymerase III sliding clamp (beta) subunit (PCNA family)